MEVVGGLFGDVTNIGRKDGRSWLLRRLACQCTSTTLNSSRGEASQGQGSPVVFVVHLLVSDSFPHYDGHVRGTKSDGGRRSPQALSPRRTWIRGQCVLKVDGLYVCRVFYKTYVVE
jgi:hypothetical protein